MFPNDANFVFTRIFILFRDARKIPKKNRKEHLERKRYSLGNKSVQEHKLEIHNVLLQFKVLYSILRDKIKQNLPSSRLERRSIFTNEKPILQNTLN